MLSISPSGADLRSKSGVKILSVQQKLQNRLGFSTRSGKSYRDNQLNYLHLIPR
jgi:hypothetical protein